MDTNEFESQVVMIQSDSFCGSKRILISMEDSENGENMAQSEMAVHMLNWVEENVKFLGV